MNQRNTKRWQMKENKKHPYRNRRTNLFTPNDEGTWAIVTSEGEVIESFRVKGAANSELPRIKKALFRDDLTIKKLKGFNSNENQIL